ARQSQIPQEGDLLRLLLVKVPARNRMFRTYDVVEVKHPLVFPVVCRNAVSGGYGAGRGRTWRQARTREVVAAGRGPHLQKAHRIGIDVAAVAGHLQARTRTSRARVGSSSQ